MMFSTYNGCYDNISSLQLQDDDSDEEPPLQPPEEKNPLYSQDQFIADFNNPAYRQRQDPRDLGSRFIGTSVLGTESVEMDELVPLSPQEMANMQDEQRDTPIGQSDTLY